MNIALSIALVLIGGLCIWALGTWWTIKDLEEPAYAVLHKRAGYEVREYAPHIEARVSVPGGFDESLYAGFRQIADYIFGNNKSRQKVAMTTPVTATENETVAMTVPVVASGDGTERSVAFVMPSAYTLESLPVPNNPQVRLVAVPGKKSAVLRFGWYPTETRREQKTKELIEALKRDNVEVTGKPYVAFYNPPLSMPLFLRTEIIIDIN